MFSSAIITFPLCLLSFHLVLLGLTMPCCVNKIPPRKWCWMPLHHTPVVCEQTAHDSETMYYHCLHVCVSPGSMYNVGLFAWSNVLCGEGRFLSVVRVMMALRVFSRQIMSHGWKGRVTLLFCMPSFPQGYSKK